MNRRASLMNSMRPPIAGAHRKLVIGNPISNHNFFYRLCRNGDVSDPAGGLGLLRKVIHVDGRDSPNVQLGFKWKEAGKQGSPPIVISGLLTHDEYVRREHSYDIVQRTTRLHGHFYEGDQAMLFPAEWLDAAMDRSRWAELERQTSTCAGDWRRRCARRSRQDVLDIG